MNFNKSLYTASLCFFKKFCSIEGPDSSCLGITVKSKILLLFYTFSVHIIRNNETYVPSPLYIANSKLLDFLLPCFIRNLILRGGGVNYEVFKFLTLK